MQPENIKTIQDFIKYCREVLAERPEYMREKEQERLATKVVAACLGEHFRVLEKQHSQLTEIFDLASNLEWSNSLNTTTDWRRIIQLVDTVDNEASGKKFY